MCTLRPSEVMPKITEADLCAAFTVRARACGWEVYAETGGWDLLLVWTGDAPAPVRAGAWTQPIDGPIAGFQGASLAADDFGLCPGDQWGIHAKLRGGTEVINQALQGLRFLDYAGSQPDAAPDFRGVLIPEKSGQVRAICDALRLDVQTPPESRPYDAEREDAEQIVIPPRFRWRTAKRHALPPIVPSFVGGHPCPKALTRWRLGALRVAVRLRAGEHLTTADFRAAGVSHSLFVQRRWVQRSHAATVDYVDGVRVTTPARFAIHPTTDERSRDAMSAFPDVGYEAERDAIAALPKEST